MRLSRVDGLATALLKALFAGRGGIPSHLALSPRWVTVREGHWPAESAERNPTDPRKEPRTEAHT